MIATTRVILATYKLDEVARSICSSSAEFDDANHPDIILVDGMRVLGV